MPLDNSSLEKRSTRRNVQSTLNKNKVIAETLEKVNSESDEFNCKLCKMKDTNRMAQCDTCEEWFHYECVGETSAIEDSLIDFVCYSCKPNGSKMLENQAVPGVLSTNYGMQSGIMTPGANVSSNQAAPPGVLSTNYGMQPGIMTPGAYVLSNQAAPPDVLSKNHVMPSDIMTPGAYFSSNHVAQSNVLPFSHAVHSSFISPSEFVHSDMIHGTSVSMDHVIQPSLRKSASFVTSSQNIQPGVVFSRYAVQPNIETGAVDVGDIVATRNVNPYSNSTMIGDFLNMGNRSYVSQDFCTTSQVNSSKPININPIKSITTEPLSSTRINARMSQNSSLQYKNLELKRLEEEYILQKKYLENKYKILLLHVDGNSDAEDSENTVKNTNFYHQFERQHAVVHDRQTTSSQPKATFSTCTESNIQPIPVAAALNDNTPKNNLSGEIWSEIPGFELQSSTANVHLENRNINENYNIQKYFDATHSKEDSTINYNLTKQQMAARNVLPKDLPTFNGNVEEWPIFISNFESSTRICGYTNVENMIRLQKCLKGKALDSVRSRLLIPSRVPDVIETLRLLFGRPEIIINALIQKIRNESPPKYEKLDTVIKFAMSVENLASTIEASGLQEHLSNPVLVQEIIEKLPSQLKLNWALHKQTVKANLSGLANWLSDIAKAACEVTTMVPVHMSSSDKKTSKESGVCNMNTTVSNHIKQANNTDDLRAKSQNGQSSGNNCRVCEANCVLIRNCAKFINMNLKEKWEIVKKLHLCRRCLKSHGKRRCSSSQICGINGCTYKHNRMLHNENSTSNTNSKLETDNVSNTKPNNEAKHVAVQSFCNMNRNDQLGVLFRVIPVILRGKNKAVSTYAFLDDGSSLSMMEESLADELGLDGPKSTLCLKWTSDTYRREEDSKKVTLEVSGINSCNKFNINCVYTVKELDLPIQSISSSISKLYKHLEGIPFDSYTNARPRILIGLTEWRLGVPLSVCEGVANAPIATRTRLGWLVYGPCDLNLLNNEQTQHEYHSHQICNCTSDTDMSLHTIVKDHFAIENFGVVKSASNIESKEDQRARSILQKHTHRINNYYESVLLWKYDNIVLPESYTMALQRLEQLEKRMMREPELRVKMNEHIQQYIHKGYARKLSKVELKEKHDRIWYLPIFPVFNPHKPQKLRIVWDAAAKTQGVSLNSMLLKGPDLLSALLGVLLRFRERRIAICGDIREMFHQVKISQSDQFSQRFLWRTDPQLEPDVLVMQVMTFGAKCSPSTAQFVKNINAQMFAQKYPRAALSITENHYVDDLLDCVDSPEEAVALAQNVKFIHNQAGFEIRNWLSNSPIVMERLGEAPCNVPKSLNLDSEIGSEKVLGMWWNTHSDCFMFTLQINDVNRKIINGEKRPTKREILRTLMSMFDPLGLIAHYLIYAKILLQDVWKNRLAWDEQVNDQLYERWVKWIAQIPTLEKFRVPRCYFDGKWLENQDVQLHVFVDASEFAYACVVYLRIAGSNGIKCSLVGAKTRVAPLKMLSIPRLELLAALLGVRYSVTLKDLISININSVHYWSDSKTVICWLQSEQRNYKQFVGFRVGEILESSNIDQWKWISTKNNVADEATKWRKLPDLSSSSRWLNGPEFLYTPQSQWPTHKLSGITNEELRPHLYTHLHQSKVNENKSCLLDFQIFPTWFTLVRTQATISRFIFNVKSRLTGLKKRSKHYYSTEELRDAENAIYRQVQLDEFRPEMAILTKNKDLPPEKQLSIERSSNIYKKAPYIDDCGVMREFGRIDAVKDVDYEIKRKIILPKLHPVTKLIIFHYHTRYHHVSSETVINEIRQKYSIPQMRATLRRVRRECNKCKILLAAPKPPRMADLPPSRLATFTRPFSFVGVDYFGPLNVIIGRKVYKRWVVLFTCLTVRAIHMEIAHSMTTDSCVLAISNFMARRGTPNEIFSDNGTNFHGCNNELKQEWLQNVDQSAIASKFTTADTKWHFNPPAAPHMGGSWERLVRSVKKVLMQVQPNRIPTDELLYSYLLEVEAIVNSRPLTYIPLDDDNDEALTPNHFLLGSSSGSKPIGSFDDDAVLLKKNWMKSQQMANGFWKRWIREYLPTITRRSKWIEPAKPIEKGDIVIIVDENSPRNYWQKGKVIDTTIAKDGQVRRAVVQTATGILTRPAVKLAVLDVGRCNDSKQLSTGNSVLGGSVATTR